MSISSRIIEIKQHIGNAYDKIEDLGIDITDVNKNIDNISSMLENVWNEYPKVSVSDVEEASLDGTKKGRMQIDLKGQTEQEQLQGYNILDLEKYPYNSSETTLNGGTVTIKDGVITVDGTNATGTVTARSTQLYENRSIIPAGTYYFGTRCNLRSVQDNVFMQVNIGIQTLNEDYYFGQWFVPVSAGNIISTPLLISKDTSKTSYEPYCGGIPAPNPSYEIPIHNVIGSNEFKIQSKNLLPNNGTSQTINGITFTVNEDGSVLVNGTATAFTGFVLATHLKLDLGTFTLSGCPTGGSIETYYLSLALLGSFSFYVDIGNSHTKTYTQFNYDNTNVTARINITSGTTVNNLLFKPQFEQGSTATDYVAHQEQNLPLDLRSKNLLFKPAKINETTRNSQTLNGITFEILEGGRYKIAGTATALTDFTLYRATYEDLIINSSTCSISATSIPNDLKIILSGTTTNGIPYTELSNLKLKVENLSITDQTQPISYLLFRVASGTTINTIIELQLEKGTTATDYEPYYNYELSKIGDAEDFPFKAVNGDKYYDSLTEEEKNVLNYGKWYLHKEVGKVVLDGSNDEEITLVGSLNTDTTYFDYYNPIFKHTAASIFPTGKSNYLLPNYANALFKDNINGFTFSAAGNLRFALQNLIASTIAETKIWLSTHNLIVYGKLETSTNTEITETPFINQLEAIRKAQSYNDQTNISQTNEDLPFKLDITALKK